MFERPQEQSLRALAALVTESGASGAALLIEQNREPIVWAAINAAVNDSLANWRMLLADLLKSGTILKEGRVLVLLVDAGRPVGVLQLNNARQFSTKRYTGYLDALARAIAMAQAPPRVNYTVADLIASKRKKGAEGADPKLKPVMLELLNSEEWRYARVSRLLGWSRRTLYLKLERWGITRPPKR
jgi:hypothetical protein